MKRSMTHRNFGVIFYFLLIPLIILLTSYRSNATYCYSVYLTSQADVDAYPVNYGCDTVGILNLSGSDSMRLDSLYQIRYMNVWDVSSIVVDFNGLNNLSYVGNVSFKMNLPNGFYNFPTSVTIDNLNVYQSDIINFIGLENITELKVLNVYNCNRLQNLNGLNNVTKLSTLTVQNCDSFSLMLLPSLDSLKYLTLYNCKSLNNIDELGSITELITLSLSGSFGSTVFPCVQAINRIRSLSITNTDLETIIFPHLTTVRSLELRGNDSLHTVNIRTLDSTLAILKILANDNLNFLNFLITPQVFVLEELELAGPTDISFTNSLEVVSDLLMYETNLMEWPYPNLVFASDLWIFDNTSLNTCCGLYHKIVAGVVKSYSIYGNASGCIDLNNMYHTCGKSVDEDADGLLDFDDNCPTVFNTDQADFDGDGVGNVCDNCPTVFNTDQADSNGNFVGDACEDGDFDTKFSTENGNTVIYTSGGLILRAVNDQCYRIIVDGKGGLLTIVVPCP